VHDGVPPRERTLLHASTRLLGRTDTVRDGDAHAEDRAAQRARWSSVTTTYKLRYNAAPRRACAAPAPRDRFRRSSLKLYAVTGPTEQWTEH